VTAEPEARSRDATTSPTSVSEHHLGLPDNDRITRTFVEVAIRIGVLALLLYGAVVLVTPFVDMAIWSAVIAVALDPAFEWTARLLGGRRRLAAALITVLTLLVVIGPATWLAWGLIDSVRIITERLDASTLPIPAPPQSVKAWPLVGDEIYQFWDLASTNLKGAFAKIAPQLKPLGTSLLGFAANAGTATLKFFGSIVIAGFFLAAASALTDAVKTVSRRLAAARGEAFVQLTVATIRTVARGVIGVSALQAVLAGIGLVIAGIPGATLITSAVLIFGIIQIGPSIVLIPVVIWSWFLMDTTAALLFTLYMVPVNLIDNVLKPLLMGRGLKTPMLVILIGVIAGTIAYGMTGLFLGPIVLAVIWELAVAWVYERPGAVVGAR
jgi:predicted PurR-regulated permease PerM